MANRTYVRLRSEFMGGSAVVIEEDWSQDGEISSRSGLVTAEQARSDRFSALSGMRRAQGLLAGSRRVAVVEALQPLFPDGGLQRGSVVALDVGSGLGGTCLALALGARATSSGSWMAALGLDSLGLLAAGQAGVDLQRLALVPRPGERWAVVAAALLDGVEILVMKVPGGVRHQDARRLLARARERGAVLVVVGPSGSWPEAADIHLQVTSVAWSGLEGGYGHLRQRCVELRAGGRRASGREVLHRILMPGPDGEIGHVEDARAVVP